jgi:hypothetical protein
MKKVFAASLCVLLSSSVALAQEEEGGDMTEAAAVPAAPEGRPEGQGIGLGMGVSITGQNLLEPNVVSARYRWRPNMAIEPSVVLQYADASSGGADTSRLTFVVGATARYLLGSRGPIDLVALASPQLSFSNSTDATDMSTKTFGLTASWGLGIEWWVKPQWSFTLDATNPFLSFTKQSMEGRDDDDKTFVVGAVWSPAIFFLTHFYY